MSDLQNLDFFRINFILDMTKERISQILNTYTFSIPDFTIEEYTTDIDNLTKEQIIKRQEIVKKFLFHTEVTVKAIFQQEFSYIPDGFVNINGITLFMKEGFCALFGIIVPAGFWHENHLPSQNGSRIRYGFDIISLHTYLLSNYNRTYSQSIEEIYSFLSTRNFINKGSAKQFYVQESNPISYKNPIFFDLFFTKFTIIHFAKIFNEHSRIIGIAITIQTRYNEYVDLYYTLWRHTNSVIFNIFPLEPQRNHSLLFLENEQGYLYDKMILTESFQSAMEKYPSYALKAFICGGFENLQYVDYKFKENTTLHYFTNRQLTYPDLTHLWNFQKNNHISSATIEKYSINLYPENPIPIEEAMNNPQLLNIEKPTVETLLATPDEAIMGSDRKRFTILEPIIESGTITWLFAQEKAGKTILALFLAQMIGVGNQNTGNLYTYDSKKVLYIDGEMPGDKLQGHIDKIIRGMGESTESTKRAFSVFLFAETDFLYEDILDETWQEKHLEELMQYDLIILDNYYTLYNSLNPIKLIRWMKKLTRKDIAFLVLDHTNSEGELQGSQIKKRAMDLGLKLELPTKSQIDITCHSDRYGVAQFAGSLSFITCFTSSEFSFSPLLPDKQTDTSQKNPWSILSDKDSELMLIYILHREGNMSKDVAAKMKIKQSAVSKKLREMAFDAKLQEIKDEKKDLHQAQKKQKHIISEYENNKDALIESLPQILETYILNKS